MIEQTVDFAEASHLEHRGVVLPRDPDVITPVIRRIVLDGRFQEDRARQITHVIRPGDQVVELGAGLGFISTLLSRERRVSSVLAVEANPQLVTYMEQLHVRNRVRKVRRLNAVATNASGSTRSFYLRRDLWASSLAEAPRPHEEIIQVPVRNLDALLRDEAATLVVTDVDGADEFLLAGADLAAVDRVLLELAGYAEGLAGVARIFETMAAQGFVYDPRCSAGGVVLFQRLAAAPKPRPRAV